MVTSLGLSSKPSRSKTVTTGYAKRALTRQIEVLEAISSKDVQFLSRIVVGSCVESIPVENSETTRNVVVDCPVDSRSGKLLEQCDCLGRDLIGGNQVVGVRHCSKWVSTLGSRLVNLILTAIEIFAEIASCPAET